MKRQISIAIISTIAISGCMRPMPPTASAIIAVRTNSVEAIAFMQSEECAQLLANGGTPTRKISVTPYRDTTLLEIRVVADTEKDALTAADAAVVLLKERRAESDKSNAIQQMLNDPRNKTESPEMDQKVATAIAAQHPQSSIQLVEAPRILVQEKPRAVK
jgi:hypothetical protein